MSAPAVTDIRKAWATLQARATLAGFIAVITELDDGRPALIVGQGAYTKCLESIEQAEAWLALVTGRSRG